MRSGGFLIWPVLNTLLTIALWLRYKVISLNYSKMKKLFLFVPIKALPVIPQSEWQARLFICSFCVCDEKSFLQLTIVTRRAILKPLELQL